VKKDKYRFTIRFCDVSPKQITATDVLNAAGRRKASLMADLIDEHITKYGADAFIKYFHNTDAQPIAEIEAPPSIEPIKPTNQTVLNNSTKQETIDDKMSIAILEGLGMFKMQP